MKIVFDKSKAYQNKAEHTKILESKKGKAYSFYARHLSLPLSMVLVFAVIVFPCLAVFVGAFIVFAAVAILDKKAKSFVCAPMDVEYLDAISHYGTDIKIDVIEDEDNDVSYVKLAYTENGDTILKNIGSVKIQVSDDSNFNEPTLDLTNKTFFIPASESVL